MTVIDERLALLDKLDLKHGGHSSFEAGACAMEAAAWLAGEPHSDHPKCVSPAIGAFLRSWNDSLRSDDERNRLIRPLLADTIGTSTNGGQGTTDDRRSAGRGGGRSGGRSVGRGGGRNRTHRATPPTVRRPARQAHVRGRTMTRWLAGALATVSALLLAVSLAAVWGRS